MKNWVLGAFILTIGVVLLGAFTRLTDAGLGCPDWPGCYGFLSVPVQEAHIAKAEVAFPERPLEAHKAWNEMIHRYFAGALGLVILFIFIKSLRQKAPHQPKKLPAMLLALVVFQAMLGMWTVTMMLMPVVVMGHLLGGFTVLSLLFLLYLRLLDYRIPGGDSTVRPLARYTLLGLVIVVAQIALGGWVSANYAALACTEFPFCEGDWASKWDFWGAYSIGEAANYEYGTHDYGERMTMHVMHRIGAVVTSVYLLWMSFMVFTRAKSSLMRGAVIAVLAILFVQIALGVSNVVFSLPLAAAVAHNGVGAALLLSMVFLNYSLLRKA